ncbi:hypothetical protein MUN82_16635 [Hymenobacter aerilatus]|uniref:Lipoprotein n=1 Tax=Hymenobacter aerilatus TaxID=2932251 RepID=A0A8T9SR47_9BACT|nr:hypothetical protein [Hymenobacter aerilatus]UOR04562.1 hypothetical protein MUN82_16635 [Hymenobacter aerilatus]
MMLLRTLRKAMALVALPLSLLTACDSTPRERQAALEKGVNRLDTIANRAGNKINAAAGRAARYDSAARVRNRQPLDPAAEATFTTQLLGTYTDIGALTATTIEPAYKQFLQQVRAQRRTWTQRDWDYATAIYRRLNEQLRAVRLDVKGRDEIHIRALQTEFTALETGRDVKDLGKAVGNKQ